MREMDEDITRLWNAVNINADIVGGVTDHNMLSNKGTIGHSLLDTLYNKFDFTGTASGTILWFNATTSHYEPHAVGTASHLLVAGVNSPYYGIPVWAASAYSVVFIAASTASVGLAAAYGAGSTASVHIAGTSSFHGFSIASHEAGRILYDDGTNYVPLAVGTTSFVLTQGAASPYWNAPAAAAGTASLATCEHGTWGITGTNQTLFVLENNHLAIVAFDDASSSYRFAGSVFNNNGTVFYLTWGLQTVSCTCSGTNIQFRTTNAQSLIVYYMVIKP